MTHGVSARPCHVAQAPSARQMGRLPVNESATLPSLTETLRHRIKEGGSIRRLSKQSGVDRAVISRFRALDRSISLATADRLARALGLSLASRD
jgi:Helix-turn-helix